MHRIYIPSNINIESPKKAYFDFVRPFLLDKKFGNDQKLLNAWGLDPNTYSYTDNLDEANVAFLPMPVQWYISEGYFERLVTYNAEFQSAGIKGFVFVNGDYGEKFESFSNLIYLRLGGFRSQLDSRNMAVSFTLSDQLIKRYKTTDIFLREKQDQPVVGFCGHASNDLIKRVKEKLKFIRINLKRFIRNPLRTDYEVLFSSAYERYKILKSLESKVSTHYIFRKNYRGGAQSESERNRTTTEYYDNMLNSDYILCLRGGGNFSVRLYETLMMGRIPVFINTDCLLPFPSKIDWKKHCVWVEWKDKHRIGEMVNEFHQNLSSEEFQEIQKRNRQLFIDKLNIAGMIKLAIE
ncbi:exostosin family protein [bacterium]|nr:exostosin family protein [bacterium]